MRLSRRSTIGVVQIVVVSTANMGSLNMKVMRLAHTLKEHMREMEDNILADIIHPAIKCAMLGRGSDMGYYDQYKRNYNVKPTVKGEGWLDAITTDYATRERRTRVLLNLDSISDVKESYDVERYGNYRWCKVSLENGNTYEIYATYDELMDILAKRKTRK